MSLTDHLVATGSHAGLPFRRDCPACRAERLAGRLPSASVAPGRATAAVVAGTLAAGRPRAGGRSGGPFRGGGPGDRRAQRDRATARAQGPGPRRVGCGPVRLDPDPIRPRRSVRLDPGPARLGPAPLGLGPGAGPLRAGPAADSGSGARPRAHALAGVTRSGCRRRLGRPRASGPGDRAQGAGARNEQLSPPPARPGQAPAVPTASGWRYIVRPNDSLWTIAELMLGKRATDAQTARLVDRIWRLNAKRIGTGDPSLIMPGQRLLLPRT